MKKFKTIFSVISICFVTLFTLSSCYGEDVDATHEAVFTYQPWIFGHGGIDMEPGSTGRYWCWASTHVDTFKIIPVKHQINMEDLVSNDNTPLDFHTVIITQLEKGKSPILLKNYGKDWFNINLYNHYCKRVRDYVSQYSPFDLMSNREVLNEIDGKILQEMQEYVSNLSKDTEMPIIVKNVIIGRAIPNKEQLAEMNKTAQEVQAKQTQERRAEAQEAREKAERQRAIADKAYMDELNLKAEDFIQLKWIEIIAEKQGSNIDVMVGPATSMWNVRR